MHRGAANGGSLFSGVRLFAKIMCKFTSKVPVNIKNYPLLETTNCEM